METPIGDDDDSHLGDFIEDTATLAPNDAAMYSGLRDATGEVLDSLTPREAKVLRMRFGIEMNTDHTLEEVGSSSMSPASGSARSRPRHCANSAIIAVGEAAQLPRQRALRQTYRSGRSPATSGPLAHAWLEQSGLIIRWCSVRLEGHQSKPRTSRLQGAFLHAAHRRSRPCTNVKAKWVIAPVNPAGTVNLRDRMYRYTFWKRLPCLRNPVGTIPSTEGSTPPPVAMPLVRRTPYRNGETLQHIVQASSQPRNINFTSSRFRVAPRVP